MQRIRGKKRRNVRAAPVKEPPKFVCPFCGADEEQIYLRFVIYFEQRVVLNGDGSPSGEALGDWEEADPPADRNPERAKVAMLHKPQHSLACDECGNTFANAKRKDVA